LRLAKKLSRKKLAYSIGMAKSYLGYIEKGQSNPTIETLYLIAGGLGCEVKDLL
jgi:XRE family transcriptional regulator, regulator of sulfur utilization